MSAEHSAVKVSRSKKDVYVLAISLCIFGALTSAYGLVRLIIAFASADSSTWLDLFVTEILYWLVWVGVLAVILGLVMLVIRLQRQQFLANALNVRHSNIAWLKAWSDGVSKDLDMPQLELFIVQEPYLNAFAFGFMKPYCIVLHSAVIDQLTHDELKAVVCHEMAHIYFRHTNITVYLAPLSALPLAGPFIAWLFGFWSRRAELTADRLAVAYLQKPELMFQALLKIHMGPDVAGRASIEGVWAQLSESSSALNQFAESLGSHPFLVRRALNIYHFSQQQQIAWSLPASSNVDTVK